MNLLDSILILVLLYNILIGLKRGAIRTISSLLTILIAFTLTKKFLPHIKPAIDSLSDILTIPIPPSIYFGICFIIVLVLLQLLTETLHHLIKWTGFGLLNHLLGILLGSVRGIILAGIIIIPFTLTHSSLAAQSIILQKTSPLTQSLINTLKNNPYFNELLQSLELSPL